MAIRHNKKGIFFTFIAILLIIVMMMIFKPRTELSFNKDIPVVKTRITKINDFITDFEKVYLPNIIKTTSYRALTSLTYYMDKENKFLTDLQAAFNEVLLYGTIDGTQIDQITGETVMTDNTLINWTNRIKTIAKDTLNVDLDFTVTNTDIYQTTPWLIDIDLTISYSVSSETANWTRNNILIKTKLGTDNLYDPLYYINTDGAYKKKAIQTDIKFDEWSTANLKKFIKNETYFHWQNSNSSSFLMRFTNTFTSSPCCGIESAINPNKIEPKAQLESYLDYLFFNHTYKDQCSLLYNITGVFPEFLHFKLDFTNLIKYNISEEDAEGTC